MTTVGVYYYYYYCYYYYFLLYSIRFVTMQTSCNAEIFLYEKMPRLSAVSNSGLNATTDSISICITLHSGLD
uniref:Uncharacterized protein n=1 Tax=Anguilla anguilla TaxID=7936 RepID=A0A0E9S702_ANGAN